MSLFVQTARIVYGGPNRLDIMRKSGTVGLFLAPSWAILKPALEARAAADKVMAECSRLIQAERGSEYPTFDPFQCQREAEDINAAAWEVYKPAYLGEMRRSYVEKRGHWDRLLKQERVVLVCYCVDAKRCHRAILREEILPKLGATDGGEVSG